MDLKPNPSSQCVPVVVHTIKAHFAVSSSIDAFTAVVPPQNQLPHDAVGTMDGLAAFLALVPMVPNGDTVNKKTRPPITDRSLSNLRQFLPVSKMTFRKCEWYKRLVRGPAG